MGKQRKVAQKLLESKHKAQMRRDLAAMTDAQVMKHRANMDSGFLASRAWKELRTQVLALYGHKCMSCGWDPDCYGKRVIQVDHIKPRRYYPHLALEITNLQVLCSGCNKYKGNRHMVDFRANPPKEWKVKRGQEAISDDIHRKWQKARNYTLERLASLDAEPKEKKPFGMVRAVTGSRFDGTILQAMEWLIEWAKNDEEGRIPRKSSI